MDITLKIDSLSYGPYGIGRDEGRVVMVPLTAPGDEAEVRIVEEKKNYAIGELTRLLRPSPLRQNPPCPYFGSCGGCLWQQIQYQEQLAAKEKSVLDALQRIGRLEGFQTFPILTSPKEYHYRRRIRLQVDAQKRIGFYQPFSKDLIEIDSCLIADPEINRRLSLAGEWIGKLKTPIRHVEIAVGDKEIQTVMTGNASGDLSPRDNSVCAEFLTGAKEINGLILSGSGWRQIWGNGKLSLGLQDDLISEVDGDVFTQVNREGNELLVGVLLDWGGFHPKDRVLELYCGAGNITLPVARLCGRITAVEANAPSIISAERNGRLNKLGTISWICSDVVKALGGLVKRRKRFSKIILNPPRSGAKGLAAALASLGAEKILYVSCNPATLARDLSALCSKGYNLTRVRPIDIFPHTYHVETLAELVRSA
jgi:23S rRNA (uracil1939-C5)-methyltransferase